MRLPADAGRVHARPSGAEGRIRRAQLIYSMRQGDVDW
jgi:hypothetical protein